MKQWQRIIVTVNCKAVGLANFKISLSVEKSKFPKQVYIFFLWNVCVTLLRGTICVTTTVIKKFYYFFMFR